MRTIRRIASARSRRGFPGAWFRGFVRILPYLNSCQIGGIHLAHIVAFSLRALLCLLCYEIKHFGQFKTQISLVINQVLLCLKTPPLKSAEFKSWPLS